MLDLGLLLKDLDKNSNNRKFHFWITFPIKDNKNYQIRIFKKSQERIIKRPVASISKETNKLQN